MFCRLFIACTLASTAPALPAQRTQAPPQRPTAACLVTPRDAALWSDPASWPGGVPGPGACVTIPVGTTMYLDSSTAALGGLSVHGELIMLCGNHTITADWIQVGGLLRRARRAQGQRHQPACHWVSMQ